MHAPVRGMYGYGPGELNGEPAVRLYSNEDDYHAVGQAYAQLAKGLTFSISAQMLRKDGTLFWARSSGRAADAGDPSQVRYGSRKTSPSKGAPTRRCSGWCSSSRRC